MRRTVILALAATIVSTSLAAQTSCLRLNWPAGTSARMLGSNGDFAISLSTGTAARTICGLQFKMAARTAASPSVFMIWSRSGTQPATLLRSAAVTIGTTYAVYGVTFPALTLAANTSFFVGYRSGPSSSKYAPIVTSGATTTYLFRNAAGTTWAQGRGLAWNYNVLCCAATCPTGTKYIPDNNATTGGCNVIPFGVSTSSSTWSNQRYQTMATYKDLGAPSLNCKLRICNIGFASCGTGDNISHCDSITIRLGQTNATALGTNFAGNLVANVKTVLSCKDFDWHQRGGQWERIGLDTNYTFDPALGRNLVIDICVTGNRKHLGGTTGFHTGARQRLYRFGWTGSCPSTGTLGSSAALKWCVDIDSWSFTRQGLGCQKLGLTVTGSAQLTKSLTATTTGALSGSTCFMVIGVQSICPGFDLGVIGAKGCKVYCNPLATFVTPKFTATVPNDKTLICQHLCLQSYCLNRGYPGGIATSNMVIITPGLAR